MYQRDRARLSQRSPKRDVSTKAGVRPAFRPFRYDGWSAPCPLTVPPCLRHSSSDSYAAASTRAGLPFASQAGRFTSPQPPQSRYAILTLVELCPFTPASVLWPHPGTAAPRLRSSPELALRRRDPGRAASFPPWPLCVRCADQAGDKSRCVHVRHPTVGGVCPSSTHP